METQSGYLPQEESVDIRKFLFKIIHHWYWFALSISVTYSIAYLVNRYKEPEYSVSGTLIINDEKKSTAELVINAMDRYSARKNIDNEIAILKSYKMAQKAIMDLKDFEISYYIMGRMRKPMLYKTAPFKVIIDTLSNNLKGYPVNISILNKYEYKIEIDGNLNIDKVQRFGVPYKTDNFNFTVVLKDNGYIPSETSQYFFVINDMNSLVNLYRSKLNITTNDKRGTVLTLSTTGFVPQMEADYLNKLMEVYIRAGLDEKNQTSINTINFIDNQLGMVVDSLHKAEDKLQNFRLANKIVDISEEGKAIMDKLEKVQSEKVTVEMQLRYFKYLQNYIEKKKDFREAIAPAIMGVEDPLLNSLVADLAKLFSDRTVLAQNAQENFPGLSMIDSQIETRLNALKENMREAINTTNLSLSEVNNRQAEVEAEIQRLPLTERHLLNIQRDFNLNDQIYNFLLQRRADAAIAKASNVADNKVLDAASALNSSQITPRTARNNMIAYILGILIPLSILLIIEFFNERIVEPKDIEKATKVPIFGSIGHNEKMSDLPVADNPKSAIAESFRALRTNLQYVMRSDDQKIICISSTISGEGKTFCSVNLASIIAQSNKKTLLMSLDLRKPKIHRIFNIDNEKGISTFLIGKTTYEETIFQTNINNLYIATSGPIPPNPAELLETPLMETFITRVKQDFDIIIMDTPPLAIVTDAFLLTRFSNAFLFVVRQNYSTKAVLQLVDDLQTKRNLQNIGILINDVKVVSYYGRKYGYNYGYGYGYGYGDLYGHGYYGETRVKLPLYKRLFNILFKS
jgi:capsular exopolysaccharide synthesis family protein